MSELSPDEVQMFPLPEDEVPNTGRPMRIEPRPLHHDNRVPNALAETNKLIKTALIIVSGLFVVDIVSNLIS